MKFKVNDIVTIDGITGPANDLAVFIDGVPCPHMCYAVDTDRGIALCYRTEVDEEDPWNVKVVFQPGPDGKGGYPVVIELHGRITFKRRKPPRFIYKDLPGEV